MMRLLVVELYKLKRVWSLRLLTFTYFILFLIFYYQKIINKHSGVYDTRLKSPFGLCSFFFLLFCALNCCWSVPFGSHLGAAEFKYNTWPGDLSVGRRKAIVGAKIMALFTLCLLMVTALTVLGIALTLPDYRHTGAGFPFPVFIGQFAVATVSAFYNALFGFTVAFILKNVAAGNIIGLGWIVLGPIFLSRLTWGKYLTFAYYQSALVKPLFAHLNNGAGIQIASGNALPWFVNLPILAGFFIILLIPLAHVTSYRDF